MDKFIRLLPLIMLVPVMAILYLAVTHHSTLRAIALLCGLSGMSLAAGYYIFQTRLRGKLIDPKKFMITILVSGVLASLVFYFGFIYFHS